MHHIYSIGLSTNISIVIDVEIRDTGNAGLVLNQRVALRFMGSGSPTATLYLYSDMYLKKKR